MYTLKEGANDDTTSLLLFFLLDDMYLTSYTLEWLASLKYA